MTKRITSVIAIALFMAGCAEATEEPVGVDIDDQPASSAIEGQGDEFRPYANLAVYQSGQVERFSFHLDELEGEEPAFMGCDGDTFSICGSTVLAYCEAGVFKNANTGEQIHGMTRCNQVPDRWDMDRKVDCPFVQPDRATFQQVSDPTQALTRPPASESLGDPVLDPTSGDTSDDRHDPSTTDGTTQPNDESSDSEQSTAEQVRTRPDGESPTQQPGQRL